MTPQPGSYKSPPPNGELVTFKDVTASPATVLGTASLSGGVATFITSSLAKGSHAVKAKYFGDAYLVASLATVTQVVERYATTTTLTSSQNPSTSGQAVTFTATVTDTGGGPTPSGTVTFYKGKVVIGTAPLDPSGVAQLTTSVLPIGTHPMAASYAHDTYNAGSLSAVVDQTVN